MSRACPKCGKPIPNHSPQRLCPACLFAGVSEDETEEEVTTALTEDAPLMPHGQFEPGKVFADRYRIVSLLGKGGMGEVYRADDLVLKEPVALKILPRHLGERRGVLEALRNEVKQARSVSHRCVCRVHDIGEVDGRPLLSMEFIEGEDLGSLLRRIGQLPAPKALELAIQLAEGLETAHEQDVLHLDLKPANLMINRKGNVKISDFGLARLSSAAANEHRIAGTPAYMAPEQALGQPLTKRTDIYAFGLILYEMLTGRRPYEARTLEDVQKFHQSESALPRPSSHLPDLNAEIEELVLSCLNNNSNKRPTSFAAIVDVLRKSVTSGEHRPDEPPNDSSIEESDVYLSFAPVDDQPLSSEKQGWITQFHRNLEIRVEQLSGRQVRVFRPQRKAAADEPDPEVLEHLPQVKAMISVLSPPFVNSSGCVREVQTYWDSNVRDGRFYVDGHTRVLKVVKTPVENDELPTALQERLQELFGFEFFEYDSESGRLKEYAEWFGTEAAQRFHERIYDLAQEVNALFKALDKGGTTNGNGGKTVYLATTTTDIAPLRDRIRRELIGRGHRVLPEKPLPLLASDASTAIEECLAESDLAIHTFGRNYGVIPEGSQNSLSELQNAVAAEYSKQTALPRVIWIPNDVVPNDDRQSQLLDALKTDANAHRNAEIVVNTFQTLKPVILDKLTSSEPEQLPDNSDGRTKRVYLICDPKDEEAIEPLEDYLYDQGFDLSLPDFEADEAEAAQTHRENLKDCDGVIIYYGAARNAWVDVKLRNILKMSGYGREQDLAFNAVYIAPPFDRRKERYRTHNAEIIRQPGEFDPSLLKPLIARLQQA